MSIQSTCDGHLSREEQTTRGIAEGTESPAFEGRVLAVAGDPSDRTKLTSGLRHGTGADLIAASGPGEAVFRVHTSKPDVVVLDSTDVDAVRFVHAVHDVDFSLPVVIVTGDERIDEAVEAMNAGADHVLARTRAPAHLARIVRDAIRGREARRLGESGSPRLLGGSLSMQKCRAEIAEAARRSDCVLLLGENFVGKRRAAYAIHSGSKASEGSFIVADCADATANALLGSADGAAFGFLDDAAGGTLLLERIEELNVEVQEALVEELTRRREPGRLRTRVIASSSCDLAALTRLGLLRADLLERLSTVVIRVPSLRERAADIPLVAEYELGSIVSRAGIASVRLAPSALHALQSYAWPGNELELATVLQLAVATRGEGALTATDVARHFRHPAEPANEIAGRRPTFAEAERMLIESALAAHHHNVTRTAEALGISPRTIHYRLREYAGKPARRRPRFEVSDRPEVGHGSTGRR